jgi:hypothetical protein
MSTLTTPFEDILIISDDQAPGRPVRSRWRAAVWIGAGSVVGLFTWAACLGLADVARDYWRLVWRSASTMKRWAVSRRRRSSDAMGRSS